MFKIEKDVPVPTRYSNQYPLDDMEVGDSFFAPNRTSSDLSTPIVRARKLGKKFTCRTKDGGVRVWRVE